MPIGREWWKIRLRGENASVGNDEEFHPDQEREHAAGVPRDACDLETDECRQHVVQIGRDVGVLNLVEAGYGEGTQVGEYPDPTPEQRFSGQTPSSRSGPAPEPGIIGFRSASLNHGCGHVGMLSGRHLVFRLAVRVDS